jgi:hypothetical protein
MMLISRVRRNGRVDLVIVLDEVSLDRIRNYDPAEIIWPNLPLDTSMRQPQTIGITFATAAEISEITRMSLSDADWKEKAIKLLSRGFEFRQDKGDHDFGPIPLGKPTEGTKQ